MRSNGSLIAHYRGLLNLTQLQLAVKAGVSERVVRKAEAGEALRNSSLQALADALSPPGVPLNAFSLTREPLAVAQALKTAYTNYGSEAIERCADILDPEIIIAIHTDVQNIAFAGEFCGIAGMQKIIRDGTAQFQDRTVKSERWSVDGNRVMAFCHEGFRLKGVENAPMLETWMLHEYAVQHGRVRRIDTYLDSLAWVRYLEHHGGTPQTVTESLASADHAEPDTRSP
jgi:transcriptional regulator with XRE-family HTH domain